MSDTTNKEMEPMFVLSKRIKKAKHVIEHRHNSSNWWKENSVFAVERKQRIKQLCDILIDYLDISNPPPGINAELWRELIGALQEEYINK